MIHAADDVQVARLGQLGERSFVGIGGRGRDVGVDLEPFQIANDWKRTILQVLAITKKLPG